LSRNFKVMIGHNARPDFAGESVKTLSDSEDSNASLVVCQTYLWPHCDVLLRKIRFSRCQRNSWFIFEK